jgi:hypothetical protein
MAKIVDAVEPGLSQTFPDSIFRTVCELRERVGGPNYWLQARVLDGRISIYGCVNTGLAERNSLTNRARKNFATGPEIVALASLLQVLADVMERILRQSPPFLVPRWPVLVPRWPAGIRTNCLADL